ncbi:phosphoglycerate mutase-like protein [Lindgomyces ingoldianus]|uniref:Phosphoglycerate mutase-like protein n=1 Tax=Lindgomyces ingoldianus TaxID=673940 RepID=A0ACB6QUM4_9PLEO|nr:phosphoglycerate mutase-like protein [Lindgomyces ingoldianus]KAF2470724.1 phosphoglycerate mutase-like protein [Lindgomyces ingoldianus]
MRLFLIRHGETVDNIAQVYAGSRDSELTNHGYQQAARLGVHFNALGLAFTHIFSSHLQRASKTAGLIRDAQITQSADQSGAGAVPDVVQLPALMEQDFGFYEGKKWDERPADARVTGKHRHNHDHGSTSGFVEMESFSSMVQRIDAFIDTHLLPLFSGPTASTSDAVAIVSHGIILSVLWKRLLLRLPPKSVAFSPELSANIRDYSLERLGGWSNTGYLELLMEKATLLEPFSAEDSTLPLPPASALQPSKVKLDSAKGEIARPDIRQGAPDRITKHRVLDAQSALIKLPGEWRTTIQTINGRDHLKGLKRAGGGLGSARHDASQRNIETFFKRRKRD